MSRILFVDRDGVLIEEPEDFKIDSYEKFRLVEGVVPALLKIRDAGYQFVMVSNQDGLGSADFPTGSFEGPQRLLLQILASQGIVFREVLIDPHRPEDGSPDRKPGVGMVMHYLRDRSIDLAGSAMVGDRDTDMQFAANLGVRGFRFGPQAYDWPAIAHALVDSPRQSLVERTTRETRVRVELDLDRRADAVVATGLGFFDHMLEQVARHGGFALTLTCTGDLRVDEHHTVEDCALALGEALRAALGDKRGIGRYGFVLPMDEALAQVAIDLSGRPYAVFNGRFGRESVGGLPTELVPHFFRSLADSLGAAIHVEVRGENAHHMIESCFKGTGRALRRAFRVRGDAVPSTKGTL